MYRHSKSESPPPSSEPSPRGLLSRSVSGRGLGESSRTGGDLEQKLRDLESRREITRSYSKRLDYGDYRFSSPPTSPRSPRSYGSGSPPQSPQSPKSSRVATRSTSDASHIQEIVRREVESERKRQEEAQKQIAKENEDRKRELDEREAEMLKKIEAAKEELEMRHQEIQKSRANDESEQIQQEREELARMREDHQQELQAQRDHLTQMEQQQQQRLQHQMDSDMSELAKQKEEVAELIKAHKQQLEEANRQQQELEQKRRQQQEEDEEEYQREKKLRNEEMKKREEQEQEDRRLEEEYQREKKQKLEERKKREEKEEEDRRLEEEYQREKKQKLEERKKREEKEEEDRRLEEEYQQEKKQRLEERKRREQREQERDRLKPIEERAHDRGYHSLKNRNDPPKLSQFDPRDGSPEPSHSEDWSPRGQGSPLRSLSPGPEFQIFEATVVVPVRKDVVKSLPPPAKVQFLNGLRRDLLQVCHHTISLSDIRVGSLTPSPSGYIDARIAISGFGKHIRSSLSVATSARMKFPYSTSVVASPNRSDFMCDSVMEGQAAFGRDFKRHSYNDAEIIDRESESLGGMATPGGSHDTYHMQGSQIQEPLDVVLSNSVTRVRPEPETPSPVLVERRIESPQRPPQRNVTAPPREIKSSVTMTQVSSSPGGPGGGDAAKRRTSRLRQMTPPSQRLHSHRSNSGTRGQPSDRSRVIRGTTPATKAASRPRETYDTVVQSLYDIDQRLQSMSPSDVRGVSKESSTSTTNSSDNGRGWGDSSSSPVGARQSTTSFSSVSQGSVMPAKKFIVIGPLGVLVREGRELTSAITLSHPGTIPQGTAIAVSEIKGNRAFITSPVVGWISIVDQNGERLAREI